jgi:tRNA-guanine family transglycosylase
VDICGEPAEEVCNDRGCVTASILPEDKPRYLMGVGTPMTKYLKT